MVYGVGVIGAGPGVASLHLPTLARLAPLFSVVHVADAGSGRAAALAARVGGRSSTGTSELLADPAVEVVAICSPPAFHAEQILAGVAAGARAVMCEKPLALTADDAERVIGACRAAGTKLLIGTNHLFDPAWAQVTRHLEALGEPIQTVTVTQSLPPNTRYHEVVNELGAGGTGAAARPTPDFTVPTVAADIVRLLVSGLAIHDLPAVRQLVPHLDEVISARALPPIGYAIGARGGNTIVHLGALMLPDGADILWRMSIGMATEQVEIEFPPPFVHDGSARVLVRTADGRTTEYPTTREDGYLAEWRALAGLLEGGAVVDYDAILDDALFAIRFADDVHAAVLQGHAG